MRKSIELAVLRGDTGYGQGGGVFVTLVPQPIESRREHPDPYPIPKHPRRPPKENPNPKRGFRTIPMF
jgi:hypothetical protein